LVFIQKPYKSYFGTALFLISQAKNLDFSHQKHEFSRKHLRLAEKLTFDDKSVNYKILNLLKVQTFINYSVSFLTFSSGPMYLYFLPKTRIHYNKLPFSLLCNR